MAASFMRIQVVDSEKSPHIQMTNLKEETRLAKDVQRLDRSRALIVNKIKVEQKTTYRRFQRKFHQSQIYHARIMCDKEAERRLVRRHSFTFNTCVSDDTEQALQKIWQPSVDLEERLKHARKSIHDPIPIIIDDEFSVPPRKVRTAIGVWDKDKNERRGTEHGAQRASIAKSAPPAGKRGQIRFDDDKKPKRANTCMSTARSQIEEVDDTRVKRPMTCKLRTRANTQEQNLLRCPSARPAPRSPPATVTLPDLSPAAVPRCPSASHLKSRLAGNQPRMATDTNTEDEKMAVPTIRNDDLSSEEESESDSDNDETDVFRAGEEDEIDSFNCLRPDTAPSPVRRCSFARDSSPAPRGATSAPAVRNPSLSSHRGSRRESVKSISFSLVENKKPSLVEFNRERIQSANFDARIQSFGEAIRPLKSVNGDSQMMDYYTLRLMQNTQARSEGTLARLLSYQATPAEEIIDEPCRAKSLTMKHLDYDWEC